MDNDNDNGNNHDKDVDNSDFIIISKIMFDNFVYFNFDS